MEKIKSLKGKTIAIVGMGKSWFDYNLAKSHGVHFDEVWSINAVASVIYHDRVFMMDPPSRFLDTDDAGGQTDSMVKLLKEHQGPIYTCELDDRCPGLVEYPIKEVIEDANCYYLNNTVAYAIAFAYWNEVSNIKLFGVDFSYQGNLHFAEAGRGCVEFWLSKCISAGMQVEVAHTSGLLDTDVPAEQKLYGYHRLADPLVVIQGENTLQVSKVSKLEITKKYQKPTLIDRNDGHLDLIEPNKW
jgi:hypothetical protein|tara:strand:- start:181 stop:912 length:732 start_codon:yes stop_codon:yes gene_type:complete